MAKQPGIEAPKESRLLHMVSDKALEPGRVGIVFFAQCRGEAQTFVKRNCFQVIIDQDMYDGLPDNLALLVFEDGRRRGVRLKGMLGIRGQANALGLNLMPQKISAYQGLNEPVLARREVLRQINIAGDFGPYAIKLSAQLAIACGSHLCSGERQPVAHSPISFEKNVLARLIDGNTGFRIPFKRRHHVPQRLTTMNENVGIHHNQEPRPFGGKYVDELIPGVELSPFA